MNVYLILKQEDQVLLLLHKDRGDGDRRWGFVEGKVEEGESPIEGMIRTAKEKVGIEIDPSELELIYRHAIEGSSLFFECRHWRGLVEILEPEKCEAVGFFSIYALPHKLIGCVRKALKFRN